MRLLFFREAWICAAVSLPCCSATSLLYAGVVPRVPCWAWVLMVFPLPPCPAAASCCLPRACGSASSCWRCAIVAFFSRIELVMLLLASSLWKMLGGHLGMRHAVCHHTKIPSHPYALAGAGEEHRCAEPRPAARAAGAAGAAEPGGACGHPRSQQVGAAQLHVSSPLVWLVCLVNSGGICLP